MHQGVPTGARYLSLRKETKPMIRLKGTILASLLLGAAAAWAQDKTPPAAPTTMDACAKRCAQMEARHSKGMADHKAMMEKNAAAWKEIRAAVDDAKKAKGDRKIADLETALDRLVSFHESMMAGGSMPGMGGMDCCGAMGADHPMAHGAADCCGDMHVARPAGMDCCGKGGKSAMADCCAHGAKGMPDDCPMMKQGT
jgi:hypothetical protein